jgi:hypothetical protein
MIFLEHSPTPKSSPCKYTRNNICTCMVPVINTFLKMEGRRGEVWWWWICNKHFTNDTHIASPLVVFYPKIFITKLCDKIRMFRVHWIKIHFLYYKKDDAILLVFRANTQPITAIKFSILYTYDFLLNQKADILRVKSQSSSLSTGEWLVHTHTHTHIYTYTHIHTQTHTHTHTHIHTHIHIHTHTYTHKHTQTHTYTYTHRHKHKLDTFL